MAPGLLCGNLIKHNEKYHVSRISAEIMKRLRLDFNTVEDKKVQMLDVQRVRESGRCRQLHTASRGQRGQGAKKNTSPVWDLEKLTVCLERITHTQFDCRSMHIALNRKLKHRASGN